MGAPGGQVTVSVSLDTAGTTILSAWVNLTSSGGILSSPTGGAGSALSSTWFYISFSPGSGELNSLALDLGGAGQPFNGEVFTATFDIDPNAPDGDVPITIALTEVRDGANQPLNLIPISGVVTVQSP